MAPPSPPDDTSIIAVRSITPLPSGLVAVTLRLPTGAQRTFVMARALAGYDNVTWSARAVGELAAVTGRNA